jgi:predicted ATPase/class 3 adenylate cyclase
LWGYSNPISKCEYVIVMIPQPTGTVTFLFTDIEGSTKLAREHSEIWETLRSRHYQILREAIESNHGVVFQVIGDAFCAAFHTAADALKAAVKAQQGLQSEAWGDCVIRVRMGIHTGEAEVHDNEYKGYLTLSLVQRLMSAGHGGQILVSGATENLLRGQLPKEVELRDLGKHHFKDVPQPVRLIQVIAPGLTTEFPPLQVVDLTPNNLPTQLTSFIGREKEAADVKRLLVNTHLLTLIGPGGTGKTRLSLQVAQEQLEAFLHGVWLVELAPISDASLVARTTAATLNLPAEVHRPAIDMLCDYLRDKELLIILDNCEHLVDACARMVDRLLHTAPKLRILASSREALGIAGEVSYRVPSLELPDVKTLLTVESLNQYEAVKLFIDRALAALPTFAVTNDNAPAVAQICHRLDGIPLALELAAAKVRALSIEQIAKRLDDRFRLLTGGSRTALERHQTLRATLDWSYNLLSENEQVLFRRLSIFVNGWTLEAAESVCSDETIHQEDVFEVLEQLVNKSLVITEEWQSETRYRMLETMRQYANEKLIEAGESERLRDRHLAYYLELAETAEPHLIRPEQLEWLDRLEAEHENMRSSLEWSLGKERPQQALHLTAALGTFWSLHCYWMEAARWLERALAKPMGNPTAEENTARARALMQEATIADHLDNLEKARASAEASLTLCQTYGTPHDLAMVHFLLGWFWNRLGDLNRAYSFLEESLRQFHILDDPYWQAMTQYEINGVLIARGEKAQAEVSPEELDRARKLGERRLLANTLRSSAEAAWSNHQWEQAEAYSRETEILYDQLGYKANPALVVKGSIALSQKDYEQARAIYKKMKEQFELIGEKYTQSQAIAVLGLLAKKDGDLRAAQSYIEEALQIDREIGSKRTVGIGLVFLGQIKFLQGNRADAKSHFTDGFTLIQGSDHYYPKTEALLYFCQTLAEVSPVTAMKILSAIHTFFRQQVREPPNPLYVIESDDVIAKARQQLNKVKFNQAWAGGETMTIDQALDLALKILDEI